MATAAKPQQEEGGHCLPKEGHCLPLKLPQWIGSPRRQSPRSRKSKTRERTVTPVDQEMGQAFSYNPSGTAGMAATNSFTGANIISNTTADSTHGVPGEEHWGDHLYSCRCPPNTAGVGGSGGKSGDGRSTQRPNGDERWRRHFCGSGAFKAESIYPPSCQASKKPSADIPRGGISRAFVNSNGPPNGSPNGGGGASNGVDNLEFLGLDEKETLHWAHGAAGEDRFQVVISEEHGWSLIGIYDGFSGHTAADHLTKHLFKMITSRLGSYLNDERGPLASDETIPVPSSSSPQPRISPPVSPSGQHNGMSQLPSINEAMSSSASGRPTTGLGGTGEEGGEKEADAPQGKEGWVQWVLREMELALLHTEERYAELVEGQPERMAELAPVGSCLLVVLNKGNDLFTMNVGDSRALLASALPPGSPRVKGGQPLGPLDPEEDELLDGATKWPPGWRPEENIKQVNFHGNFESVQWSTNESSVAVGQKDPFRRLLSQSSGVLPSVLATTQLTVDHLLSEPLERERLISEHPDDKFVIHNERVKGKLKVTRAFGAGFLKKSAWNDRVLGMFRVKYVGTAPYLVPTPTLRYRKLNSNDRFLLLSSDGVFQFFTNEQAVEYVQWLIVTDPHTPPARGLAMEVMRRAAQSAGLEIEKLNEIPHGDRRYYHDDITILVLPLLPLKAGSPQ